MSRILADVSIDDDGCVSVGALDGLDGEELTVILTAVLASFVRHGADLGVALASYELVEMESSERVPAPFVLRAKGDG